MGKSRTIKEIIFLLDKFYCEGNVSVYSLLEKSGYFELYDQISEGDIFRELTKHQECIDQWLGWSESKRSSSGWYFKENENGQYIVGYFPFQKGLKVTEYFDKTEACSAFIKREIEDIRKN